MQLPTWPPISFRARLAVALATAVASSIAFMAIYTSFGVEAIALTAVPLVVGALLFGVRGGLVAWLLVIPLNMALHLAVGFHSSVFGKEAPVRLLVALAVGLIVGELRDLASALRREAFRREREVLQREHAETQLRLTLMAIPDLVFRLGGDGTFRDLHAGSPEDLNVPAETLRGRTVVDLLPPEVANRVLAAVARTLSTGAPQTLEYQLPTAKGPQDYEARMVLSGPDEVLTIARNVTQKNKLDGLLRQQESDRLEARVKEQVALADRHAALGTLAAGAAHEINNPLAAIISNLGFLDRRLQAFCADPTPESGRPERAGLAELQEVVQEAAESAERVRVIVRDLGTFSRTAEGASGPVDVRIELESAISLARREFSQRATVVRDYGEVAPIEGNPAKVVKVFFSLLVNASQAIPEGAPGKNEIRVVTRMDGLDHVLVEIHDTGSGLSPAVRDHLFDPFFTTKAIGAGTGLGLYTCLHLVSAMGGTITGENEPDRGSVFRVRLPASAPTP